MPWFNTQYPSPQKKEINIQTMMNYYSTIMSLIYKKKTVSSIASLL